MRPSQLVQGVLLHLAKAGGLAPWSLGAYTDIWSRFARFCERGLRVVDADAVTQRQVQAFLDAPRASGGGLSLATKHLRRGAVRYLYKAGRELGLVSIDPTVDLVLPARSALTSRRLTEDEVELCRLHAVGSPGELRLALVWALSEAGARASEIPWIKIHDVDLANGVVFTAGGTRTDPRWAPLTDWGVQQLRRRLSHPTLPSEPEAYLVPWRSRAVKRPGSAATMAVIEVLRAAEIHGEPDVRPASVTGWAAARLLHGGRSIDEVARALGCKSLDVAAQMAGLRWRPEGP
ncbi:MAG: tyrosine-type recombinase/integrase [Actinomycetota bacterium]|nr:tyrosine-type recombinase/integrase [Actinomycetota bacterium]